MIFKPTIKIGQTKYFKLFYSGPPVIREIINDLNIVTEDEKTKSTKGPPQSNQIFNSRSATIEEKRTKKAKSEPRIPQTDLTENINFLEIEVVTPRINDIETREVIPEGNNGQISPTIETHNETVKE